MLCLAKGCQFIKNVNNVIKHYQLRFICFVLRNMLIILHFINFDL